MNFNIQKALIFLACLNIVLFAGGVRVVDTNTLDSIVDKQAYENNDTVKLSENFKGSVPQNFEKTGETEGLSFIDTLQGVSGFIIFIVNIIFTPIGLFASLPAIVGLMLGVPIVVGTVMALIYFIRSGR